MTYITCDGFETYGDATTSFATLKTNVEATDDRRWVTAIGLPNGANIVAGYDSIGLALEVDDGGSSSARGENVVTAFGSGYNESTAGSKEYAVGFRYYNAELLSSGTVPHRRIWWNTVGTYSASPSHSTASLLEVGNDNTTLRYTATSGGLQTFAGTFTVNTWHYIECHYIPAPAGSGGFMKIYVDGSLIVNDSVNNVVSATFFKNLGMRIGSNVSGGNNNLAVETPKFDDVYAIEIDGVTHTDVLGDCRVIPLAPTSDATPNDWTPSTGANNYALIDETDWDTTDYVDAATAGDDEHYGLDTLSGTTTVHGVRLDAVCIAVSGTPTLHIGFDDGTADEDSMGVIGTGSTVQKVADFPLDPSGASWNESSINAVDATQRIS